MADKKYYINQGQIDLLRMYVKEELEIDARKLLDYIEEFQRLDKEIVKIDKKVKHKKR